MPVGARSSGEGGGGGGALASLLRNSRQRLPNRRPQEDRRDKFDVTALPSQREGFFGLLSELPWRDDLPGAAGGVARFTRDAFSHAGVFRSSFAGFWQRFGGGGAVAGTLATLRARELGGGRQGHRRRRRRRRARYTLGFGPWHVCTLDRLPAEATHDGCVNCASWSADGSRLLTGSDDRKIKIWALRPGRAPSPLVRTASLHTGHRSNVFCARFAPGAERRVVTCAADGELRLVDLELAGGAGAADGGGNAGVYTELLCSTQRNRIMHMFEFLPSSAGDVLFTAQDDGLVARYDLRERVRVRGGGGGGGGGTAGGEGGGFADDGGSVRRRSVFLNNNHCARARRAVKAIAFETRGLPLVAVGGAGKCVRVYDLRMPPGPDPAGRGRSSGSLLGGSEGYRACVQSFCPAELRSDCQGAATPYHGEGVSVSGLCYSSSRPELCVSYQGDQIYTFSTRGGSGGSGGGGSAAFASPVKALAAEGAAARAAARNAAADASGSDDDSKSDGEEAEAYAGARPADRSFGGHINHRTFLKTVAYFGPADEFIVSGSDSGHLFVYDERSGRVANALRADRQVCNGVVPHPTLPLLASYGIDSAAKLWDAGGWLRGACAGARNKGGAPAVTADPVLIGDLLEANLAEVNADCRSTGGESMASGPIAFQERVVALRRPARVAGRPNAVVGNYLNDCQLVAYNRRAERCPVRHAVGKDTESASPRRRSPDAEAAEATAAASDERPSAQLFEGGHALERLFATDAELRRLFPGTAKPDAELQARCDVCDGRLSDDGEPMWHCLQCNYSLCGGCRTLGGIAFQGMKASQKIVTMTPVGLVLSKQRMTWQDIVGAIKQTGNAHFKAGRMGEALFAYIKGSELYATWGSAVLSKAWTWAAGWDDPFIRARDSGVTAPFNTFSKDSPLPAPFRVTTASRARASRAVVELLWARVGCLNNAAMAALKLGGDGGGGGDGAAAVHAAVAVAVADKTLALLAEASEVCETFGRFAAVVGGDTSEEQRLAWLHTVFSRDEGCDYDCRDSDGDVSACMWALASLVVADCCQRADADADADADAECEWDQAAMLQAGVLTRVVAAAAEAGLCPDAAAAAAYAAGLARASAEWMAHVVAQHAAASALAADGTLAAWARDGTAMRAKAGYRRGTALARLGLHREAAKGFAAALLASPGDRNIRRALRDAKRRAKTKKAREQRLFKKMFGK